METARPPAESRAGRVTIVSGNPETLDALQQYLSAAGLGAAGTSRLDASLSAASKSSVVVLFPDDFQDEEVESMLTRLCRSRPSVRTIVVTSRPGKFAGLRGPIVIPKPVWGWRILETIRNEGRTK